MKKPKSVAQLATEEIKLNFFVGKLRDGPFASDDELAAIISKHCRSYLQGYIQAVNDRRKPSGPHSKF